MPNIIVIGVVLGAGLYLCFLILISMPRLKAKFSEPPQSAPTDPDRTSQPGPSSVADVIQIAPEKLSAAERHSEYERHLNNLEEANLR